MRKMKWDLSEEYMQFEKEKQVQSFSNNRKFVFSTLRYYGMLLRNWIIHFFRLYTNTMFEFGWMMNMKNSNRNLLLSIFQRYLYRSLSIKAMIMIIFLFTKQSMKMIVTLNISNFVTFIVDIICCQVTKKNRIINYINLINVRYCWPIEIEKFLILMASKSTLHNVYVWIPQFSFMLAYWNSYLLIKIPLCFWYSATSSVGTVTSVRFV